jgi:CTP-dependent riboflavin kinase
LRHLRGTIVDGVGDFRVRMTQYPAAFERATGEKLFPGTLNLRVDEEVPPRHHFVLTGAEINEPSQDLWFEIVRVNGIWAYRIRPYQLRSGGGGHGDDILEIASRAELRPILTAASQIEIELFR